MACVLSGGGTELAVSRIMDTKTWSIAAVMLMLSPFATEALTRAAALIADLHIAEFAGAANALTTLF